MSKECKVCGSQENIHQHHISYERDETVPVCQECHYEIHKNEDHPLYPEDEDPGKRLHLGPWTEEELHELRKIKGHRSWERALEEEFGTDLMRYGRE